MFTQCIAILGALIQLFAQGSQWLQLRWKSQNTQTIVLAPPLTNPEPPDRSHRLSRVLVFSAVKMRLVSVQLTLGNGCQD